jgi:hypothetical protein
MSPEHAVYLAAGIFVGVILIFWWKWCCKVHSDSNPVTPQKKGNGNGKKIYTSPKEVTANINDLAASSLDMNPPPSYPVANIPQSDTAGGKVVPPAASISNFKMNVCDSVPAKDFWQPIYDEYNQNVDTMIKLAVPYVYQNPK